MEPPDQHPRGVEAGARGSGPRERPELVTAGSRVELSLGNCKMRSLLTHKLTIFYIFFLQILTNLTILEKFTIFTFWENVGNFYNFDNF